MNRFDGKVALVTGGGGGIGSAIARRFASEGAHVVVTDVNAEAAAAVAGEIGGTAIAADISKGEGCRALVAEALAKRDRIDILVNNAGINRRGNILAISEEDWQASFAVNLDAMFHLCRAVIPGMMAAGAGRSSTPPRSGGCIRRPIILPITCPRRRWRPSPRTSPATTPRTRSV